MGKIIDRSRPGSPYLASRFQRQRPWPVVLARHFGVLTAGNHPNVNAYLARLETHPGFIKSQA